MTTFYNDKKIKFNEIISIIRKLNTDNKKIVFVCIGTPYVCYDSFGPKVGSMLKLKSVPNVYGTMCSPLSKSTIPLKIPNIKEMHKNDFIIGIDACVAHGSEPKRVCNITIDDYPIHPRRGKDDSLAGYEIGDISIKMITQLIDEDKIIWEILNDAEMMEVADSLAQALILL